MTGLGIFPDNCPTRCWSPTLDWWFVVVSLVGEWYGNNEGFGGILRWHFVRFRAMSVYIGGRDVELSSL